MLTAVAVVATLIVFFALAVKYVIYRYFPPNPRIENLANNQIGYTSPYAFKIDGRIDMSASVYGRPFGMSNVRVWRDANGNLHWDEKALDQFRMLEEYPSYRSAG